MVFFRKDPKEELKTSKQTNIYHCFPCNYKWGWIIQVVPYEKEVYFKFILCSILK